jgi:hypothetical protein
MNRNPIPQLKGSCFLLSHQNCGLWGNIAIKKSFKKIGSPHFRLFCKMKPKRLINQSLKLVNSNNAMQARSLPKKAKT